MIEDDRNIRFAGSASRSTRFAVASVALGIVGSLLGLVPFAFWAAIACGGLAIVFGAVALRGATEAGGPRVLPLAGVILGLVALAAGVAGAIAVFTAMNQIGRDLHDTGRDLENVGRDLEEAGRQLEGAFRSS